MIDLSSQHGGLGALEENQHFYAIGLGVDAELAQLAGAVVILYQHIASADPNVDRVIVCAVRLPELGQDVLIQSAALADVLASKVGNHPLCHRARRYAVPIAIATAGDHGQISVVHVA